MMERVRHEIFCGQLFMVYGWLLTQTDLTNCRKEQRAKCLIFNHTSVRDGSLVVVAKEGTPYKWKITNDYFKLEVFDFVEKCMECRNWVAQCKAKDWFGEIGLCSSSKRRVLEMDVGVASDWWIWLLWPPSTQTNVYRSSIICICKVQVSFYQTLSLFHLTQCHIDPSRLHFLVLSGWSTLWKLQ